MPIIRKVIKAGPNSFAITLPKTWLDLIERETGKKVTEVTLEVTRKIIIAPLTVGKKQNQPNKGDVENG